MSFRERNAFALDCLRPFLRQRVLDEGLSEKRGHWSIFVNEADDVCEPRFISLSEVVEDLGTHAIPFELKKAMEQYDPASEYLVLFSQPQSTALFKVPIPENEPTTLIAH